MDMIIEKETVVEGKKEVFDRIVMVPNILNIGEDEINNNVTLRRPLVNITETSSDYAIEVAVPGLEVNDFKLELDGDVLIISAGKLTGEMDEGINYRRQEFTFNSFRRGFRFGDDVILEEVIGEYLNGIFCVFVPKKEEEELLAISEEVKVDVV